MMGQLRLHDDVLQRNVPVLDHVRTPVAAHARTLARVHARTRARTHARTHTAPYRLSLLRAR